MISSVDFVAITCTTASRANTSPSTVANDSRPALDGARTQMRPLASVRLSGPEMLKRVALSTRTSTSPGRRTNARALSPVVTKSSNGIRAPTSIGFAPRSEST